MNKEGMRYEGHLQPLPKGRVRLNASFIPLGSLFLSQFLCSLENLSPSGLESLTTHPL